jgi:hypothetical protein
LLPAELARNTNFVWTLGHTSKVNGEPSPLPVSVSCLYSLLGFLVYPELSKDLKKKKETPIVPWVKNKDFITEECLKG